MRVVKLLLLVVMAAFYIFAGVNHFRQPDFYLKIMPDYLPLHHELVFLSGVCEVVLGVLVLIPPLRSLAAWGIVALLIAIFPANVHMAVNNIQPTGMELDAPWGRVALVVRLLLQGVLIAWAWWYTQPTTSPAPSPPAPESAPLSQS